MVVVNTVTEAKASLSALIEKVIAGQEVIISRRESLLLFSLHTERHAPHENPVPYEARFAYQKISTSYLLTLLQHWEPAQNELVVGYARTLVWLNDDARLSKIARAAIADRTISRL